MDVIEAIRSRMSVRKFKPPPFKRVFKELLDASHRLLRAMNTQPWEITVVTGEALENLKSGNLEAYNMGVEPHPEAPHVHIRASTGSARWTWQSGFFS